MTTHASHREDGSNGTGVVLDSGSQAQWEHAMQRLAAIGPVLLIDAEPPDWPRPQLADARTADLLNPPQVMEAVPDFALTPSPWPACMDVLAAGSGTRGEAMDCRQLAAAVGLEPVPAKVEGGRSKAKRLAARGWLAEERPGLFSVPVARADGS
ncbi:hypothetical protein ABZ467_37305 [Streptomyces sp. NPDC005727]|uniref:hypothetical protein n=1 Tax=Streptomyces sp. NPDC005727 TaxID=3157053 RepID=UPI0033D1587C